MKIHRAALFSGLRFLTERSNKLQMIRRSLMRLCPCFHQLIKCHQERNEDVLSQETRHRVTVLKTCIQNHCCRPCTLSLEHHWNDMVCFHLREANKFHGTASSFLMDMSIWMGKVLGHIKWPTHGQFLIFFDFESLIAFCCRFE